ncbi:uncharacterized protein LTR77_004920 [Saxophila tyrrhenica]|uniref:Uncharacterized protein n=1 Tax=Saxophila tyrrhenica TaxID=1690608 RepID=A0AAV9PES3_9PEZI|nr:hypothetical protein LTR77_004920 [Saxophila tyrrhenica]
MADPNQHSETPTQEQDAEAKANIKELREISRLELEKKELDDELEKLKVRAASLAAASMIAARAYRQNGKNEQANAFEALAKRLLAEPLVADWGAALWEGLVVHLLTLPVEECKARFEVPGGIDAEEFWKAAEALAEETVGMSSRTSVELWFMEGFE